MAFNKSFEQFRNEIYQEAEDKPYNWRLGQFVFNYVDSVYGVARECQFAHGIDCFFTNDENKIDEFIKKSYELVVEHLTM